MLCEHAAHRGNGGGSHQQAAGRGQNSGGNHLIFRQARGIIKMGLVGLNKECTPGMYVFADTTRAPRGVGNLRGLFLAPLQFQPAKVVLFPFLYMVEHPANIYLVHNPLFPPFVDLIPWLFLNAHIRLGKEIRDAIAFLLRDHRIGVHNHLPRILGKRITSIVDHRVIVEFLAKLHKHVLEKYPTHVLYRFFVHDAEVYGDLRYSFVYRHTSFPGVVRFFSFSSFSVMRLTRLKILSIFSTVSVVISS